ncbi:MAG: LamG-like jellyroll fold domain-containing protein [Balneolaceae bacterium]
MCSRVFSALPIIILTLFTINLYAQDSTSVDTLVAYYSFNGNASDSSGFGNDGEVFGASLTEDRFGNPNSAYFFDGDNDYINTNTSFDFPERSVSIWVKPHVVIDSVFNHQIVLNQDSDLLENGAFGISMINGIFRFKEGNTEEPWEQEIEEDNWYHLIMVRRDTSVYGYINGELIGIGLADDNSSMSNPNETLLIGTSRLFDRNFDGLIDDIRIYNYAISDSLILDLYKERGWPIPEVTIPDTLIAYYPFDESAADSSGFENDGQVFGASLTEDRFGNPNSAYSFDGINDFIEIPDDSTFTSPTKTVEFWFNKTNSFIYESIGFAEGLIWKSFDTDANRDFSFQIRNKLPPFDIYNAVSNGSEASVYTEVSNFIESATWYHVVGVIDTSSNSLYINGQHIVTEEHDGEVINHGAPISIGRSSSSSLSNRYFRGKIDDIKIYNYALNESAILDSYSSGGWPISEEVVPDTLVAHYPFNGDASDSSGFGNDGQVFGPLLAEDRFGNLNSAYAFDGLNDYIEISDDLVFTSITKTIEFWFNKTNDPTKTTGDGLIWKSFGTSAIRDYSFMLTREEGSFGFYNAVSNGSDASVYTWMDSPIYADRWYHIVGIVDTSSNSLYVNGEHIVTVEHDGEVINHGAPITIGKASVNSLSTRFFKGSIDDIKIYNYVLSDSAIIASFTKGDWPLPPPPVDSTGTVADTLIAYYPFDGNAIDSSGFNNNGIVFGSELTEDRFDRMNSAYYFDGSDYIDFGSSDTIEFAREDFSISVWVKPTSSGKSQYQILRKGSDFVTDGEARWSLALDELGKIRMIFEDADQGDSTLVLYGENSFLDDKWHHIGVVFDRDSTLRVYVDNQVEISSEKIVGYSGYVTNQEDFSMYAGRGNSGASQFSFVGAMDDIRIYSYALEDSAIRHLYSEGEWPIDSTGTFDEGNIYIPEEYLLYQNFPNPFNPSTTIKFDLPESGNVTLKVFDITGRLVANLVDETKTAGRYQVNFNASNLASGIYLYELRTNKYSSIKKFTLIK